MADVRQGFADGSGTRSTRFGRTPVNIREISFEAESVVQAGTRHQACRVAITRIP